MYTADIARDPLGRAQRELDLRIEEEVNDSLDCGEKMATLRIDQTDVYYANIREELEKRGFQVLGMPDEGPVGYVTFGW